MQEPDTIAAISTPLGEGGIGIIKISGPAAYSLGVNIFFPSHQNSPGNYPEPRKLYHGIIRNSANQVVDEVLVSFMPAPFTYTREDIVEINCHSGIFALRAILQLVLENGARLAEPGEFTRRAFVNGRIDLSQAEAVMSMIKARSEEATRLAARSLRGELSVRIETIRSQIVELRAPIEAAIDYPDEYDDSPVEKELLRSKLTDLKDQLLNLLQGIERNRAFQEGVSVAIIGRPNVGKSSLLNALLHQQKAIVHEKPGTTRDLLEGYLNLGGYPLRIIDTAGIQGTEDPVEKEGIERSRYAASEAKLLIVVLDGSAAWNERDAEIAALKHSDQGLVIVINKQDLEQKLDLSEMQKFIDSSTLVRTAALKEEGIKELEAAISDQLDQILSSPVESPVIVSIRHEEIINDALHNIEDGITAILFQPIELVSFELQNAWQKLGEISGVTYSDALLDKIFSEFCLGK